MRTGPTDLMRTLLCAEAKISDVHGLRQTAFRWRVKDCIKGYVFQNLVQPELMRGNS